MKEKEIIGIVSDGKKRYIEGVRVTTTEDNYFSLAVGNIVVVIPLNEVQDIIKIT